ncbi:TetR family transcriptional regulator [Paenibacillus sp. IHB B 3084]|uniref:TetR/AcrR family transcriptional regulator n=2 Tax=unclassified Paenibacillus TaxID=185978 RepID=UPI00071EAA12|nr:TetR/AcrR family transcriptional regulator [Paenibacillus sp. IHB B 3084]ALP38856.1 TetR family transcriptional regulator [Paenibacillus sp. IHB B 3084]
MGRAKEFDTQSVLRKAMAVFGEHGYEGTSLTILLDQLGIARQSLYDTYGTKYDLFFSAIQLYIGDKTEAVVHLLSQPGSIKEAIAMIFNESVRVLTDPKLSKECFIMNSAIEQVPHHHEIKVFISASTERLELAFYNALVRAHKEGEIHSAESELRSIARFLNHARLSLTFTAKTGASPEALKDIVRTTLSILD